MRGENLPNKERVDRGGSMRCRKRAKKDLVTKFGGLEGEMTRGRKGGSKQTRRAP